MKDLEILVGNCMDTLASLQNESIDCCITSPPYYGLRDYGIEGQLGLEESPLEYTQSLVKVFREVKRVLKDDGTLWLNLGDSYAANRTYQVNSTKGGNKTGVSQSVNGKSSKVPKGLKPKDLIGIPWMVAFALQADGWYLRQDIIWHKPNVMPESVTDRCTRSHEYIFLLSKSRKYYYDNVAIKEPVTNKGESNVTRNKRSVWSVNTKSYSGSHIAVFPPELVLPCVLAGSKEGGVVLDPFGGSGTTAGIAISQKRKSILCELNPMYIDLIDERVKNIVNEFSKISDNESEIRLI